MYNAAIRSKIASKEDGEIPEELINIIGFIDGSADEITRPRGDIYYGKLAVSISLSRMDIYNVTI